MNSIKNRISISLISIVFIFQLACSQQQPVVYYPNSASVNSAASNSNSAIAPTGTNEISPSGRENLKLQAQELSQTLRYGDFTKIADFTHPKVLQQIGGRAKVIESSKAAIVELKKQGIVTDAISVGEPTAIVSVNRNLFANVPLTLTMKTPKGTMKQESSVVGISGDDGANWKFVNGVNQEQFNKLFPEAANKILIPEVKPPTLVEGK